VTRLSGILVLGLLACGESPAGLPAGVPTITPLRQWSGGTVQLQGELFESGPAQFTIRGRDSTLAWHRLDASTIAVTLPNVSSDTLTLTYDSPRGRLVLGTIDVAGFREVIPTSQPIYAPVDRWPGPSGQQIIGIVPVDPGFGFQVAVLDPVSGGVTVDPRLTTGGRFPGLSYRAGVVLLPLDQSLITEVWQLHPVPMLIDTLSILTGRVFELKPFTLLIGYNYSGPATSGFLISPDSGVTWTLDSRTFREPTHLYLSPAGDRAAAGVRTTAELHDPEIPVFDLATGDVAYTVGAIYSLGAAEFSPDGDLLYMTGSSPGFRTDSSVVIIANASDGTMVRQASFPTQALGLTLDAVTDRLLIPTAGPDCRLHLMVLNASTLVVEADLLVPLEDSPCNLDYEAPVILYRSGTPLARVVRPLGFSSPAGVFTFDLRE
jgi:hypothetical protein